MYLLIFKEGKDSLLMYYLIWRMIHKGITLLMSFWYSFKLEMACFFFQESHIINQKVIWGPLLILDIEFMSPVDKKVLSLNFLQFWLSYSWKWEMTSFVFANSRKSLIMGNLDYRINTRKLVSYFKMIIHTLAFLRKSDSNLTRSTIIRSTEHLWSYYCVTSFTKQWMIRIDVHNRDVMMCRAFYFGLCHVFCLVDRLLFCTKTREQMFCTVFQPS